MSREREREREIAARRVGQGGAGRGGEVIMAERVMS